MPSDSVTVVEPARRNSRVLCCRHLVLCMPSHMHDGVLGLCRKSLGGLKLKGGTESLGGMFGVGFEVCRIQHL